MKARRTQAASAALEVFAVHGIHVCRRASEVADIPFEIRHTRNLTGLTENRFRRARGYEFALMCRDCAESAAAETAPVEVDAVAYHFVGRYHLALVAGMWQTGIGQVERRVDLALRHCRQHGVDFDCLVAYGLP